MIGEPKRPLKQPAAPRPKAELPAYFYRLSKRAQQVYLRSDAIDHFDLAPGPTAFALADALMDALADGRIPATARAAQQLVTELCRLLRVRTVPIEVKGVRPHNARGELHGIFYPQHPRIVLWMRTAQRHDIVKPRTFVRTLMHELGHHLDYALLKLGDSYHTRGFFQRESSLVHALRRPESDAD